MSVRVRDVLAREFESLRHEPTQKRIRGTLGGRTVVDSQRAVLVWEPRRIVPVYAVPAEDIEAEVVPAAETAPADAVVAPLLGDVPVLDPTVPFAVHTAGGEALEVVAGDRRAGAFRLDDDGALGGYVALDFAAFDAWYEEDELNVGHPRDPFHRIDVVPSSRHLRVERDGRLLAESRAPFLLFEPPLPVRYYLAPEDVVPGALTPSDTVTYCAYKGRASYWSAGDEDVAWTYREPLHDAIAVKGRIAFFNERVDLVVDGAPLERPVTPWSRR